MIIWIKILGKKTNLFAHGTKEKLVAEMVIAVQVDTVVNHIPIVVLMDISIAKIVP
jgi:hypothetical protein